MDNTKKRKLVSIVIPVYNEELVIEELGKELKKLMQRNNKYDFEAILVENGSVDNSLEKLLSLHSGDKRFKILQLSKNFTADGGVAAGLNYCKGDCAVLMDADLQDPPLVVDEFLRKWELGYEVVYGVINSREGVGFLKKVFNKIFYLILNFVTAGQMPQNVTAFRLMDKVVYRQLNRMNEKNRFTRGLCAWTGFRQIGVRFDRAKRFAGKPKSYFWDILDEAFDAIFSFSFLPLRCITILGVIVCILSFILLAYVLVIASIYRNVPGYRSLVLMVFMMFGFMFISLGIMGEYIARIFEEVKNRPIYIVKDEIGFEK
jgi:dolichol-phosphate mannosyltransferase